MPKGIYNHKSHTKEHNKRISKSMKGKKPKFIPDNTGRILSTKHRQNLRLANLGKHPSKETLIRMRKSARKGCNNPAWKGGLSLARDKIRYGYKYNEWRQDVFIRDNFTCQKCGVKGVYLAAHHKKPFHTFMEEIGEYLPLMDLYEGAMIYTPLWDVSNGETLCKKCHKKISNRR